MKKMNRNVNTIGARVRPDCDRDDERMTTEG